MSISWSNITPIGFRKVTLISKQTLTNCSISKQTLTTSDYVFYFHCNDLCNRKSRWANMADLITILLKNQYFALLPAQPD